MTDERFKEICEDIEVIGNNYGFIDSVDVANMIDMIDGEFDSVTYSGDAREILPDLREFIAALWHQYKRYQSRVIEFSKSLGNDGPTEP